jgi:hypothetical protein
LYDRDICENPSGTFFQLGKLRFANPSNLGHQIFMDFVFGDSTGLRIPAHSDSLRDGGADFLTAAFRAFGALPAENRVMRITRFEHCPGGSTGQKLFLSVEYERADPALHTDLFVKFSRDFGDKLRDRGRWEIESEVKFAAISRLPGFPIDVPTVYFADFHKESGTGILITRRIPFGEGAIEPHYEKCLDHELAEPIAYYRVIVQALARIAAAHRSGRLARDISARFPFDPQVAASRNPIRHDEARLRILVGQYAEFVARCPQLVPPGIAAPDFIAKLEREAVLFKRHEATVKRFLQGDPDFIALCHWNANIDNAWFWRDASGTLHCGLMDWGNVDQLNVAFALWGCLSSANLDIWDRHLDELLRLFTNELHAGGGPRLEVADLKLHLDLYVAMMALFFFLDCPARILDYLPAAAQASGPRDPVFRNSERARNQLQMLTVVLNMWRTHDFGAGLDTLLKRLDAQAATNGNDCVEHPAGPRK